MFKRLFHIIKATPPKIGSQWVLETDNPFDSKPVTVLDTQNGWVLYKFAYVLTGSLPIHQFRILYTELPHD